MVVTKHPSAPEEGFFTELMGLAKRANVGKGTNEDTGGLQGVPVVWAKGFAPLSVETFGEITSEVAFATAP
jgi:hypothetical protein